MVGTGKNDVGAKGVRTDSRNLIETSWELVLVLLTWSGGNQGHCLSHLKNLTLPTEIKKERDGFGVYYKVNNRRRY